MAGEPDALQAIQQLEEQISDSTGKAIALVAYESQEKQEADRD